MSRLVPDLTLWNEASESNRIMDRDTYLPSLSYLVSAVINPFDMTHSSIQPYENLKVHLRLSIGRR